MTKCAGMIGVLSKLKREAPEMSKGYFQTSGRRRLSVCKQCFFYFAVWSKNEKVEETLNME